MDEVIDTFGYGTDGIQFIESTRLRVSWLIYDRPRSSSDSRWISLSITKIGERSRLLSWWLRSSLDSISLPRHYWFRCLDIVPSIIRKTSELIGSDPLVSLYIFHFLCRKLCHIIYIQTINVLILSWCIIIHCYFYSPLPYTMDKLYTLFNYIDKLIKIIFPIAVLLFLWTITSALVSIKVNISDMSYYIHNNTDNNMSNDLYMIKQFVSMDIKDSLDKIEHSTHSIDYTLQD